jgi:hypothetical protein
LAGAVFNLEDLEGGEDGAGMVDLAELEANLDVEAEGSEPMHAPTAQPEAGEGAEDIPAWNAALFG